MSRVASLRTLASRRGRVTAAELRSIRRWLDEDWESRDVDRDAVRLIRRLADELETMVEYTHGRKR